MSSQSRVPLVAQIVLHLLEERLQLAANPQRQAGGQNINDHQMQQARHHRAVTVVVL